METDFDTFVDEEVKALCEEQWVTYRQSFHDARDFWAATHPELEKAA